MKSEQCILRLIQLCDSNELRHNHASVDQSFGNRRPFHLILFRGVFFVIVLGCWELQFLGCNINFIKTHRDTRSERMFAEIYSITTCFREYECLLYWDDDMMEQEKKNGIVYMLASQRNLLFSVDSISYFLSPHPTEIAWTPYFQVSKKKRLLLQLLLLLGQIVFFFRGIGHCRSLAARFQCMLYSTSTVLDVQPLQTPNVCLLTRWLLFFFPLERVEFHQRSALVCMDASVLRAHRAFVFQIWFPPFVADKIDDDDKKIVCPFVSGNSVIGGSRTCVFPRFLCTFASMLLFSSIHCRIQSTVLLYSVSFGALRAQNMAGTASDEKGREREPEPKQYDATIHRRMEHATVMIINTAIVVLCIYLIVTSPLQHFRFFFFSFLYQVEFEVHLSILRVLFMFMCVVCSRCNWCSLNC